MTEEEVLEIFGQALITQCRDKSIEQICWGLSNTQNPMVKASMDQILPNFSLEQREELKKMVPFCVDTVLAMVLGMIEEIPHFEIKLSIDGETYSLRDISDGLEGELYGEDGWIAKYAKTVNQPEA